MLLFPSGTPFVVTMPPPRCMSTLSCTRLASDQFPLLAMQEQVSDDFGPACFAPAPLVDVP